MSGLSQQQELTQLKKRARRRLVGAIVLVLVSTAVLWNVVGAIPDQKMKPEAVEIVGLESSQPAPAPAVPAPDAASAPLASAPAGEVAATEIIATLPGSETPAPSAPVADEVAPPPAAVPSALAPPAVSKPPVATAPKAVAKPKPVEKAVAKPAESARVEPARVERDPLAILEGRESAHKPDTKTHAAKNEAGTRYMVQLAALSDPAKVAALKSRLAANGLSASFSKVETSKGEVVRVRMGPFASRDAADAALSRLARAGVNGIVVTLK